MNYLNILADLADSIKHMSKDEMVFWFFVNLSFVLSFVIVIYGSITKKF